MDEYNDEIDEVQSKFDIAAENNSTENYDDAGSKLLDEEFLYSVYNKILDEPCENDSDTR